MLDILRSIGQSVGVWLYVIAGFLAFGEAAFLLGVVLPGEAALLVAGYYTHEGVLNLPLMIVIAVVSAILGDTVGFEFGRHFGPPLRRSRLGHIIGEKRWSESDTFLKKHGGKAVFLGRLTAVLRAVMPSMAGMSRMHYPTFLAWNAAGGIIWGTGCVLLGYFFASALDTLETYLTWLPLAALAVLVVGWIAWHFYKRRRDQGRDHTDVSAADTH